MEEAKQSFRDERLKEAAEYAGEYDLKGQLKHITNHEVDWHRVAFLEVNQIEEFDMDAFQDEMAEKFQKLVNEQELDKERKEYGN